MLLNSAVGGEQLRSTAQSDTAASPSREFFGTLVHMRSAVHALNDALSDQRSRIMGGVTVDLLFLLVLIFKAACEDDVDFSNVACKDVTGHVGKESTLNCTVIYSDRCRAVLYKFIDKDKDTTICREKLTSKYKKQHFSCSYTPNEAITTTFKFFLQANCGFVKKEFSVNTAGGSDRIKGDPVKETSVLTDGAEIAVVLAAISCFIIFVMGFVLIRKHNAKKTCGFQKNCLFVCDDNNLKNTQIEKQCDSCITTIHNIHVPH